MIRSEKHQTPRERAVLLFTMATTLLHEMAHATQNHVMGRRPEEFFEDALVAEAGFDYTSRIFGMLPNIAPPELLYSTWRQWQNIGSLNQDSYPINKVCRNGAKLATTHHNQRPFGVEFTERLLNNKWWEEVEDRSADLIPDFLLCNENAHLLETAPTSFRTWARGTAEHQHEAEQTPLSPLQIRQPTPPLFGAIALEFDLPSIFQEGNLVC
jgi:hypothetical protein